MKSFSGTVRMFDEEVYIEKSSGVGYERVLEVIDPLLCG